MITVFGFILMAMLVWATQLNLETHFNKDDTDYINITCGETPWEDCVAGITEEDITELRIEDRETAVWQKVDQLLHSPRYHKAFLAWAENIQDVGVYYYCQEGYGETDAEICYLVNNSGHDCYYNEGLTLYVPCINNVWQIYE